MQEDEKPVEMQHMQLCLDEGLYLVLSSGQARPSFAGLFEAAHVSMAERRRTSLGHAQDDFCNMCPGRFVQTFAHLLRLGIGKRECLVSLA